MTSNSIGLGYKWIQEGGSFTKGPQEINLQKPQKDIKKSNPGIKGADSIDNKINNVLQPQDENNSKTAVVKLSPTQV